MRESENKNFSLNKEQLDSLRLETQALSPEDYEKMKSLIDECDFALRSVAEEYLPTNKAKEHAQIAERFLAMDKATYEKFDDLWLGGMEEKNSNYLMENTKGVMRTFLERGDFVSGFIPDIWEKIPVEVQKQLADAAGGEKSARKFIASMAAHYTITHELSHLYQDPTLPLWLSEAGAYYYAQEVMKKNKWGSINSEFDSAADFYRELLRAHGEKVHNVYFGKLRDEKLRQEIFAEFTSEKQALIFPDYAEEEK